MGNQTGKEHSGGVSGSAQDWVGPKQMYHVVYMEHNTAGKTLTKEQSGSIQTNLGASGAIAFALPQDAPRGCYFDFVVMAAQELRVDPGAAGGIYISGAKQTDDLYITANDEAESIRVIADGNGDWVAWGMVGTWTVEGA